MRLSEVMTRNVECTTPEATLQEVADRMKELNVGSLPVRDGDRLVGMITDRDIIVRGVSDGYNPWINRVKEIMTAQVHACFEDQDVAEALALMSAHQIRRLPVLDRSGQLVGIVSLGDLATETGEEALAGQALEGISEPAGCEPNA